MRLKLFAGLLALLLLASGAAYADTVTWNQGGFTFTAWASGSTQVSFTITNTNATTDYWDGFALKDTVSTALTGATIDATSTISSANATPHVGFNNGAGTCSGNDPFSFCVDFTGGSYAIASGATQTVVINLSGTGLTSLAPLSQWDLQTLVTTGANASGTTIVSLSQTGTVVSPEPASMSLLVSGLVGLGGLLRMRRRRV